MSRSDCSRQECRRTGQHYGGSAPARSLGLTSIGKISLCALLSFLVAEPIPAQSLLNIRVLEGEGAVCSPGAKVQGSLVVQVTDETGRPVEGAAVSFRLPEEGPGGGWARGMKTEIGTTTPEGRAAAYGMECNRTPGPFQIRVTAVKDQIRAGVIVSQYVSERTIAGKQLRSTIERASSGRRKWLWIAIAAGGAAAGAIALGSGGGKSTPTVTAPPAPPTIGSPTITIGNP